MSRTTKPRRNSEDNLFTPSEEGLWLPRETPKLICLVLSLMVKRMALGPNLQWALVQLSMAKGMEDPQPCTLQEIFAAVSGHIRVSEKVGRFEPCSPFSFFRRGIFLIPKKK